MTLPRHLRPPHPVHLVGAGPGDPELLTLKAVRVLRAATVVLVDDLVGEQVLASVLDPAAPPTSALLHLTRDQDDLVLTLRRPATRRTLRTRLPAAPHCSCSLIASVPVSQSAGYSN